jgi:hypothetical protein
MHIGLSGTRLISMGATMEKVLMSTLTSLSKSVEATAVSPDCKHTVAWCLGKLPALYAHYQATNESRYGDEITRLVQALIKELTRKTDECQEAYVIANGMIERFQLLHERLNLPTLVLKGPPEPVVARTRKSARK